MPYSPINPWNEYSNFDYSNYWKESVRNYEDKAERIALKRMLDNPGRRLIDLGANYGRLTNEYNAYSEIFLTDGAFSANYQAQKIWGKNGVQTFVSDIRCTPLPSNCFDTVMCIRTLHHQSNIELIFHEASRLLKKGGTFIFSFANKSNLKQRVLNIFGRSMRQIENLDPIKIGSNIYNFHPRRIINLLSEVGLQENLRLGVGILRLNFLSVVFPTQILADVDGFLQLRTAKTYLAPSIFIRAEKK